jgi:hypothetical protein
MLSVPSAYVGGRSCFRRAQSSRGHRELSLEQGDVVTWMTWMGFHQAVNPVVIEWRFMKFYAAKMGKTCWNHGLWVWQIVRVDVSCRFSCEGPQIWEEAFPIFLFTVFSLMKSTFAALGRNRLKAQLNDETSFGFVRNQGTRTPKLKVYHYSSLLNCQFGGILHGPKNERSKLRYCFVVASVLRAFLWIHWYSNVWARRVDL